MTKVKSDIRWIKGQIIPGVVTLGDPVLKQKASPVKEIKEVKPLCEEMVKRLRELNGAGLAAPQIGESLCIIVVEVRKTDMFPNRPESPLYVMVNPKLVPASEEKIKDWEGCFSVPGIVGVVPRYKKIEMQYTDIDGSQKNEVFEDYLARVIQHEYDHLNGIEFLDRMDSLKSLSTVENWKKYNLPIE